MLHRLTNLPTSLTQLAAPPVFLIWPFLGHCFDLHKNPSELTLCQDPGVWWWETTSGGISISSSWTRSRPNAGSGSPPLQRPPHPPCPDCPSHLSLRRLAPQRGSQGPFSHGWDGEGNAGLGLSVGRPDWSGKGRVRRSCCRAGEGGRWNSVLCGPQASPSSW